MSANPNPFNLPTQLLSDEPAGTLARTVPRYAINVAGGVLVSGNVHARLLPLAAGTLVTNLAIMVGNTSEAGGTHGWYALLDANANVLAVTADQAGAAFFASATYIPLPVGVPYLVPRTGIYYAAVCITAATTMPTIAAGPALVNGLNAGPPVLQGSAGAGAGPPAAGSQLNAGVISNANPVNFGCWVS